MIPPFIYSEGMKVRPKGQAAKRRYFAKYRAVVINTYATDEQQNTSSYQVRCDILLVRSQIPLANVPVLAPAGVNDAQPWTPTPTTGTFSGNPLNLRTFSKRGTFEGNPTPLSDLNGDHVLIEFIEGDPDFPMIVGKLPHQFTNRAVIDGDGWSDASQDTQRGTPEKREAYFRHWGTEVRVNASGDVLVDTVGATPDIVTEVPSPTGGEVRVRMKRGQEAIIAGGSMGGAGNLGGDDLFAARQDIDGSVNVRMGSDEVTISVTPLGVTIVVGGIVYSAPTAGPATINMLSGAEPFVKGTAYSSAMSQLVTALNVYAAALGSGTPADPVTKGQAATAATALVTALGAFLVSITGSLSLTIKGE